MGGFMSLILDGTNGLSDVDGTAAAPAIRGTDANTGIFFPAADTIAFATGGTEDARFNASGNLQTIGTISVGNATPSTSGAGITFPATQSASFDANTLDDYEEGTWTPAYAPSVNSFTSITYGFNEGKYTKIGRMVYVAWRMRTSALTVGSGSGFVLITGLPFTTNSSVYCALGIGTAFAVNNAGTGVADDANTYITLQQERNNTNITVTDLSTSSANNFTAGFICYQV
jgi:hypothetical protein